MNEYILRFAKVGEDEERRAQRPDEDLDQRRVERLHRLHDVGDEGAVGIFDMGRHARDITQ